MGADPPVSRRALLGLVALVLAVTAAAQWWAHRQEQALARELARAARPGDVLMISSDTCIFCHSARRWMTEHAVAFGECSIERDVTCAERYRALASPGTPLMLVRGKPQLGFNPGRVLEGLSPPV